MTQDEVNFKDAIKDLRAVAPDIDTAEKISKLADRIVDAYAFREMQMNEIKEKIKELETIFCEIQTNYKAKINELIAFAKQVKGQ